MLAGTPIASVGNVPTSNIDRRLVSTASIAANSSTPLG
jgi:hypothetical protein